MYVDDLTDATVGPGVKIVCADVDRTRSPIEYGSLDGCGTSCIGTGLVGLPVSVYRSGRHVRKWRTKSVVRSDKPIEGSRLMGIVVLAANSRTYRPLRWLF